MSQSCFSLEFLFQNFLWKLFTFRGYKGIYSRVCEECEKIFFCKTMCSGDSFTTGISREITARLDCHFCPVVFQLSWTFSFLYALHVWHVSELSIASHSWDLIIRTFLNVHTLELFTLSHTQPLHDPHLNTRYLIVEIQANLAWNKANTWLNKFNLTISPFGYSATKL